MKYLARQGIGIQKRQAEVISVDQEDMLWEKGMLGEGTPQQLLDTMVYLIGLNCALRAGDEHRYLRTGPNSQFEITVGADGLKGLKYMEDVSKTNRGGLKHRQCERKCVKVGQNLERPERPKDGKCNAFYLRPLKFVRENTWYADIPIGLHPLRGTIGRLCKVAGFSGFYSNHSLRATTATRLYDSGLDEQLIAERTGHKSVAIRSYKRTSAEMEARVDNIIQRKSSKPASPTVSTVIRSTSTASTASTLTSTKETNDDTASRNERDLKLVLRDGVVLSLTF
ncbi:uncharacterized protein KIAA1958-like [Haliotis rufescens]|uniref:uncharacterized protein KIAA1958-like n=1 Tax=Haliotis rufescens TaxID=6454 RepID=UPI00201EFB03|nr:uncharacterized protein KIAA1958-like [Haliotis rufescens]